jgi:hypothetical protein
MARLVDCVDGLITDYPTARKVLADKGIASTDYSGRSACTTSAPGGSVKRNRSAPRFVF